MKYRFARFEFDAAMRELSRDGQLIPIEPKVFDFLALLLREHHQIVPRGRILRELWPGTVVCDSAICRLVKEARRAIGDSGVRQEMIRTVRGTGYRFVGPIEQAERPEGWDEARDRIEAARRSLEGSADSLIALGQRDLRAGIEDFVLACLVAIEQVRELNPDELGS